MSSHGKVVRRLFIYRHAVVAKRGQAIHNIQAFQKGITEIACLVFFYLHL